MKFRTLAIDSASELSRLIFSFDMKKHVGDYETIRAVQNYPGATERLNMMARRLRDFKAAGLEIVIIAHEGIDKIYAKGGMIGTKGAPAPEPAAIKGRIDIPGTTGPEEVMRVADNIFRVQMINGSPVWVANPESIPGSDGACWQVKDRFHAQKIKGGLLPPSYMDIAAEATKLSLNWSPPYIWIIYGGIGFHKTRSLLTFPRPIKILDVDQGTDSIRAELTPDDQVFRFNSEESDDYPRFMVEFESTLEDPKAVENVRKKLNVK